ncbi:nitroreductase family protein [Streptomyces acidiscabies]|uniref:nitroreductase family protein n=1 Tax=Streptomyces acidiscabies TaxID=42234 RepID=UPI00067CA237|nr:nitroreductase family protein [Streptomyces acidiscabies]
MRARRSVRTFLPTLLPLSDIRAVLEDARTAPSNCNTQPWTVHIVSGAARDALSGEILKADDEGRFSSDYADFGEGTYLDRAHHHAATLTRATGLKREDRAARQAAAREGLKFFGAPHAAFFFMPRSATAYGRPGTSACTGLPALPRRPGVRRCRRRGSAGERRPHGTRPAGAERRPA